MTKSFFHWIRSGYNYLLDLSLKKGLFSIHVTAAQSTYNSM